jgi:hypothetical protein
VLEKLTQYELEKHSKDFVDNYQNNYLKLKAAYYRKVHDSYFDKVKGNYEPYFYSIVKELEIIEGGYIHISDSDDVNIDSEFNPDYSDIFIQDFYNETDLFITLISPNFQYPGHSVFIAVDGWYSEFEILANDNPDRPRIKLSQVEPNKDFIKFYSALSKYCGSHKTAKLEKYGRIYVHRLIASINDYCVGKHVHHCDTRSINNHPANLKAFNPDKHLDIHLVLDEQSQERKDLFFQKIKSLNPSGTRKVKTISQIYTKKLLKFNEQIIFKILYLRHRECLKINDIPSRFRGSNIPSVPTIKLILKEYGYFKEYFSHYVINTATIDTTKVVESC